MTAELRSRCPVARSTFSTGAVLSRCDDVAWGLRRPELLSSEMDAQLALGTARPMIPQRLDPPAQTRCRRLLDRFSNAAARASSTASSPWRCPAARS